MTRGVINSANLPREQERLLEGTDPEAGVFRSAGKWYGPFDVEGQAVADAREAVQ